jgi:hypothetical protein
VEVARFGNVITVRDSKDPDRPGITYGAAEWDSFIKRVKSGAHDCFL